MNPYGPLGPGGVRSASCVRCRFASCGNEVMYKRCTSAGSLRPRVLETAIACRFPSLQLHERANINTAAANAMVTPATSTERPTSATRRAPPAVNTIACSTRTAPDQTSANTGRTVCQREYANGPASPEPPLFAHSFCDVPTNASQLYAGWRIARATARTKSPTTNALSPLERASRFAETINQSY